MTTEINDQLSETDIERANRAIKEAEQAYQAATAAPHKLRASYTVELAIITDALGQLGLETPVEDVVKLLTHRDALNFLIQASEKSVRPSRAAIEEATRQRDGVIRLYHQLVNGRSLVEVELEYLEVIGSYLSGGGLRIPHLWFRKRRTNSRQTDAYLRQMIESEIRTAAQSFKPQKLIEVRERLQQIDRTIEELGGDRLKTESLSRSY